MSKIPFEIISVFGARIADFGILGLWTMVLLYEKFKIEKERSQAIKDFSVALAANTQTLQSLESTIENRRR